jgi:hypothetical protein
MTRVLLTAMSTIALVAVVGGCSIGGSQEPNGLLTRSSERSAGEMTAIVGGTLAIAQDGRCVLLSGKPVVWPAETTLTTDPRGSIFPAASTSGPAT